MALQFIWFIVLSAFLHAFYNFLMRRAAGDEGLLLTMFVVASGLAGAVAFFSDGMNAVPWRQLPYVYGASFFYIQYQILVSKAYESGNISALYPLTVLSPIFIPIWAFFFLSETISFVSGTGIVLTVVGATPVKIHAVTMKEVFVSLAVPVRQVAIIFAIFLGVVFLKEKIEPRNVIGSGIIIAGIILIQAGV